MIRRPSGVQFEGLVARLLVPDDLAKVTQVDHLPAGAAFMEMVACVGRLIAVHLASDGRAEVERVDGNVLLRGDVVYAA